VSDLLNRPGISGGSNSWDGGVTTKPVKHSPEVRGRVMVHSDQGCQFIGSDWQSLLPWESTMAAIDPDLPDREGIGAQLPVAWVLEYNGAGYDETAFLGEPMDGNRQVLGLWEYIRRYMEEGPQSVSAPKRLRPIFPWPWESVRSTLSFLFPIWRRGARGYALVAGILLSPLMALHAMCHWLSLLLCWPTQWPKVIAEAGLPGKPVPKTTVAEDHGEEIGSYLRTNAAAARTDDGLTGSLTSKKKSRMSDADA